MSSVWPTPTNAQALAVLDAIPQWASADEAIAAGLPEQTARSYLAPDGVIPRMRLLSSSWERPGGKVAAAGESWWSAKYKYPLWVALDRYVRDVDAVGDHHIAMDEGVADQDAAALSHAVATIVEVDAPPVFAAPCPRWIIPVKRGALPAPNPECLRKDLEKNKDKIAPLLPRLPSPSGGNSAISVLLIVIIGYYLMRRRGK